MLRPKKHLGQHFLTDNNIAQKIVNSLIISDKEITNCLEIGPGEGVLTKYLLEKDYINLFMVEIDNDAYNFLQEKFQDISERIFNQDFLKMSLPENITAPFVVIGNFPYNISSQIFFKIIDFYLDIPQVVCMLQKEVAQRIAANHGNKTYGILSVILQTFYDIEYLFTVNENVFYPPPNVKSAVIRMIRNKKYEKLADKKTFILLVKTAFATRRKTMRNALKSVFDISKIDKTILDCRAEQLSVEQFIEISNLYSDREK